MDKVVLIIGLGSMGKRRIRNLHALGLKNIVGLDKRSDRRLETETQYSINTFGNLESVLKAYEVEAFVISLPPDIHHIYMKKAVELGIPAFIEASVVDTDLVSIIDESKNKKVFLAPSCTLFFHPAIKKIQEIINKGELGKLSNFIYHSGQYLPDWHKYEGVNEYYVSNKSTGGGREIVPFELTWITMVLGFPKRVVGFYKKTIEIDGAPEIDDVYNLLMDYGNMIFNLSVDVVSRFATRRLTINGDKKQLYWNWDDNVIRTFEPQNNVWEDIFYETISAQSGYNKNITEQMYIDEIDTFLKASKNQTVYPNSLDHDHKVLNLLYAVEASDRTNQIQNVK
ncbi:Gfo/Idh/MocA family protein [Mucilaginibacter sp. L3T2-6]|uniref:Gfo/Idh/MocA family protein n=1 Tax=Mucilaginibacter sp. L3T2-6 TaxID=3062491 RepID=UPI002676AF52|nr:Gfo/Idh/MocA family oxidoreductase [Mucilaginibacter sp. L3T2-6]MDO3642477.1 Gfo/Idh/MocA family oxidoreductase [Mucilaginibacter sp. L3T2-6]MDV6215127.1 Gfo/Idh/MocA family oxidoreductase [Mucilaginibacter sp. L3T2-6]